MVTKKQLMSFNSKIKYTSKKKNLPFSQGYAINKIIQVKKIPAIRWGWQPNGNLIGVETKKQFLIFRDKGLTLNFEGIINK